MDSPFIHIDSGGAPAAARGAGGKSPKSPFIDALVLDLAPATLEPAPAEVEQALPEPPRSTAPPVEVAAPPQLQFLSPSGGPYSASGWVVQQGDHRFEGRIGADGWTGAIDAAGGPRFDPRQPFVVHVEGAVC